MIWNPISLIFYFIYKLNTKYFKQRSFAIYLGILGTLIIFNFLVVISLLLINQIFELKPVESNWIFAIGAITVCLIVILSIVFNQGYNRIIEQLDGETPSERIRRILITVAYGFLLLVLFYANFFLLME